LHPFARPLLDLAIRAGVAASFPAPAPAFPAPIIDIIASSSAGFGRAFAAVAGFARLNTCNCSFSNCLS